MKWSVVVASAALAVVSFAATAADPEAVGLSRERLERIDAMLEQRIAAGDLAGAIAIVARRGEVAHVSMHGVMDLETRQPMRADTLFRIASMTKPIIGVGIMMMVEENKLRLSDPVSRYIPEFRNLKVAVARPEAAAARRRASISSPRSARSRSRICSRTSRAWAAALEQRHDRARRTPRRRNARRLHPAPRRHRARVSTRHALGL